MLAYLTSATCSNGSRSTSPSSAVIPTTLSSTVSPPAPALPRSTSRRTGAVTTICFLG